MSFFYRKIKQTVASGTTTWTYENLDEIDMSSVSTIKGDITGHIVEGISTLTADGAVILTTKFNHLAKAASAGAYTLVAASSANTGIELEVVASTAKEHVVTCTGTFSGIGVSTGNNTATFGGAIGDRMRIVSNGTTWVVVEPDTNVTFSTVS